MGRAQGAEAGASEGREEGEQAEEERPDERLLEEENAVIAALDRLVQALRMRAGCGARSSTSELALQFQSAKLPSGLPIRSVLTVRC